MTAHPTDDDELVYIQAVDEAVIWLRAVAGMYPICPKCFCELIIDRLEMISRNVDHGEPLPPIEVLDDSIGDTEGTA